jgi:acetyltransferase-like isoleucine patch superfamily enzyme
MVRWLGCGVLACANPAFGATWVVDDSGGADFTSIQAAINAATSGDRIEVRAGTYVESSTEGTSPFLYGGAIEINKSIQIIGEGSDVVVIQTGAASVDISTALLLSGSGTYTIVVENVTLVNQRYGPAGAAYGINAHWSTTAIAENSNSFSGTMSLRNVAFRVTPDQRKGVIYKNSTLAITAENCVFDLGQTTQVGRLVYSNRNPTNFTVRNSIFRNTDASSFLNQSGTPGTYNYSLFAPSSGSAPSGTGNLHATNGAVVGFSAPESLDYTLLPTSSAINAGDPSPTYNDLDGSRNDMGLYGGPYAPSGCPAGHDEVVWAGATTVCLHPDAVVSPLVQFGDGAVVGDGATVAARATVGAGAVVEAHASVGRRAQVGDGAQVGDSAFLAADTLLGDGATLGDGAFVGYGAAVSGQVGAGATVGNLATVSATASLGAGSKLGRSSTLAAGAVVAENASLGADVSVLSGVTIGAGARIGRGACVGVNVPAGARVRRGDNTCT